MVIFAMIHFSVVGVWMGQSYSIFASVVVMYSLICLFSFFNVSYVRNFDALQVNIAPMVLTLVSLLHL